MELKKLNIVVAKLHREKPMLFADIYDAYTEFKIAKKINFTNQEDLKGYLLNLKSDEIYIRLYSPNGSTYIEKGIGEKIDLAKVRKEIIENEKPVIAISEGNQGNYPGMNAPELLAKSILLERLESEYDALKKEYQESLKNAKKLKRKVSKLKEENLLLNITNSKKPFLNDKTTDRLLGMFSNFSPKDSPGLNAAENQQASGLSKTQNDFIAYIKTIGDEEIKTIYKVYQEYKGKQTLENNPDNE